MCDFLHAHKPRTNTCPARQIGPLESTNIWNLSMKAIQFHLTTIRSPLCDN